MHFGDYECSHKSPIYTSSLMQAEAHQKINKPKLAQKNLTNATTVHISTLKTADIWHQNHKEQTDKTDCNLMSNVEFHAEQFLDNSHSDVGSTVQVHC